MTEFAGLAAVHTPPGAAEYSSALKCTSWPQFPLCPLWMHKHRRSLSTTTEISKPGKNRFTLRQGTTGSSKAILHEWKQGLLWGTFCLFPNSLHYILIFKVQMQVRKQQLELDMEQQHGSKSGKEYIKAVCCHPAYLTSMQSTSWETLGWRKHKLESWLLGEISITSDMQITPPLWQKVKKN